MTGPPGEEMYAVAVAHFIWWLGFISMNITMVPYALANKIESWAYKLSLILGYIIAISIYYCMLRCQYMDPGVLFREFTYEDEEAGFPTEKHLTREEMRKAHTDIIRQGAHIYKPRYCHTCNIMRPPKASHCGICDN